MLTLSGSGRFEISAERFESGGLEPCRERLGDDVRAPSVSEIFCEADDGGRSASLPCAAASLELDTSFFAATDASALDCV
jgi:hypothetical protein